MRSRFIAPVAASALFAASMGMTALPASATPQAAAPSVAAAAPVKATATSTINETIAGIGNFVGTFTPTQFTTQEGQLAVTGLVNGVLTTTQELVLGGVTYPAGSEIPVTDQSVTTLVEGGTAGDSCKILTLDLGPLHLDVLGLVIDLNEVNLDITAVGGAGNLLGNLLCAVTGLLDGNGLTGLINRLNRLLGL